MKYETRELRDGMFELKGKLVKSLKRQRTKQSYETDYGRGKLDGIYGCLEYLDLGGWVDGMEEYRKENSETSNQFEEGKKEIIEKVWKRIEKQLG